MVVGDLFMGQDNYLHIRLFGSFEVRRGADPLPPNVWGRRKTQDVLKVLAGERGRVFAQDELIEVLFPDLDPDKARTNLQARVSRLRKVLEPDLGRGSESQFIRQVGEGYCLARDASCWIDVEAFRHQMTSGQERENAERWSEATNHYDQALMLYRGVYLADDRYAEWVLALREQYSQLYLETLERLTHCHIRLGQYRRAIKRCRQALEAEPYRESAYRQLILGYAYRGDRQKARQAYEACQVALREHLDAEPAEQIRELIDRIEQGELAPPKPAVPHNLPYFVSRFIGRHRELAGIRSLLESERLVTLTGAGGSGKSRLAVEAAFRVLDRFPDGVWFVDLAPRTEPTFMVQEALTALGIRERADEPSLETVVEHLRTKQSLILIDNCEHLINACADFVTRLLQQCAELTVLVTSRQRLGLTGEANWVVPPLSLPRGSPEPDQLPHYDAIALFVDRARTYQPAFGLTAKEAEPVLRVCRELDGLPLALELAASRLETLTVRQIADLLHERFRLLTAGSRTALPRHQTMRAVMDWSYELLAEEEQMLLRRLSVFAGGFTLEAVEAVCSDEQVRESEVLDSLSELVRQSLVRFNTERYSLLETVRQYAHEKLTQSEEDEQVRDAHTRFYLGWLAEIRSQFMGKDQIAIKAEIMKEAGNVRAAWRNAAERGWVDLLQAAATTWAFFCELAGWFREGIGAFAYAREQLEGQLAEHQTLAHRLAWAGVLTYEGYFHLRLGQLSEGQDLLSRSLDLLGGSNARVQASLARLFFGIAHHEQGDLDHAEAMVQESLADFNAEGERLLSAIALHWLGDIAAAKGAHDRATECYEESLSIYQSHRNDWGISRAAVSLGELHHRTGSLEQARTLLEQGVEAAERLESPEALIFGWVRLGRTHAQAGKFEQAIDRFEEALEKAREIEDRRQVINSLMRLGEVSSEMNDHTMARHHFHEALDSALEFGSPPLLADVCLRVSRLLLQEERQEQAVKLLAMVAQHPATEEPIRERAHRELAQLGAALDTKTSSQGARAGAASSLEEMSREIQRLLA